MVRTAVRHRQRLRWARLPNSGPGHVYERVTPVEMKEPTVPRSEGFTMSEAMKEALKEVEVEANGQGEAGYSMDLKYEAEGVGKRLKRIRYNFHAPVKMDWHGVPWITALRQGTKSGQTLDFFTPTTYLGFKNIHNTITGYHVLKGLVQTHKAPHPISMIFQYWNLDKTRRSRFVQVPSMGVAVALEETYTAMLIAGRPGRLLHHAAAKAMWRNCVKFWLVDSQVAYWYLKILGLMGDVDEIEAVDPKVLKLPSGTRTVTGLKVNAVGEVLLSQPDPAEGIDFITRRLSEERPEPIDALLCCSSLIRHYYEKGVKGKAEDLVGLCQIPVSDFKDYQRVVWLILLDLLRLNCLNHNDAKFLLTTVVPYFAENPNYWPEEILEAVVSKQPTVQTAYRLMKAGINAGLPQYDPAIPIPPPRGGFRGVLAVCSKTDNPKTAKSVYEFMLQEDCRPGKEETHYLAEALARTDFVGYLNLLRWVSVTHEIQIGDYTLQKSFCDVDGAKADPEQLNEIFRLCTSLYGGVSGDLVRTYFKQLVRSTESPLEAFVELMQIATTTLFKFVYNEEIEFPLRIGSKEVVTAVIDTLEPFGTAANLTILEELLESCHSQWGTHGYTPIFKKSAVLHTPGRGTADIEYTSALPVTDAWMLSPFGFYDVVPKHIGIPEDIEPKIILVHWSVLVYTHEAARWFSLDEEKPTCVVTARQLHHALKILRSLKDEYLEVPQIADALSVPTDSEEWGTPLRDALAEINSVKAEPQQLEDRVRLLVEKYCAYLPYEAEVGCLGECGGIRDPTAVGGVSEPTDASFIHVANHLASMGYNVTCLTEAALTATSVHPAVAITQATTPPTPLTRTAALTVKDPPPLSRMYPHLDVVYHSHVRGVLRKMETKHKHASVLTLLRLSGSPKELVETLPWRAA